MSGSPKIPTVKREAAIQMRAGGATTRQIAAALGVSKGYLTTLFAPPPSPAVAAAPPPSPATTAPALADPSTPAAPSTGADGIAADIARLVEELRQLRVLTESEKLDGSSRIRASAQIGQLTSRLAVLRREQRAILAPERDATVLRAGHAAADKLRRLLEEAIGEAVSEEP